jgi:ribonuclease HI/probable phosphoglycerate mutase
MDDRPDCIVYTDGASRGNPGPSSAGVVVCDGEGRELNAFGKVLDDGTNNQAEYKAAVEGLKAATEATSRWVELRSDSELVIKQLRGDYEVRDPVLHELHTRAKQAEGLFQKVTYSHVPREHIGARRADQLANRALDHARRH